VPFIDDWGSGQIEIEPDVWYPGVHPLAEAQTLADIEKYPWPDMDDPSRVAHVREHARHLAEEGQYGILATPWLLFPLERAFAMQGMDRFLPNAALNPDFAQALLLKIASLCKTLMGHFLQELGENVDIIKIGDDLGTQDKLLISPQMYRRLLKPIHADYIAFIKQRTHARVFFHTDGDIFDLIDDFIEIGVDILNPIQTSAGKMANLAELKKRYGKKLCLCGAIDTHRVLPFGSPQEVRQEVHRVIDQLAPGGGYLLAAVHTIMDEVPSENILAMVDAVEEFGRYPIESH
jgi:uroporphyrinogen decarboxylase